MEISPKTADFIAAHAEEDVRLLALRASGAEGVDLAFALNQISCMQAARKKLPSWHGAGVVYPPALSMEQCSSEQTATYKAQQAQRIVGKGRFADLTGGFGVDFAFISRAIGADSGSGCIYVEAQQTLCECAAHNFPLLGLSKAEIVCSDGTQYIRDIAHRLALAYLDPSRRDAHGRRTYDISACTPNVVALLPTLLDKSDNVMIKLSPMLDWRKAVADLNSGAPTQENHVAEVHIISVAGECKELLMVVNRSRQPLRIFCANDSSVVEFCPAAEPQGAPLPYSSPRQGSYLYEPNASIMKAGCFDALSARYRLPQISANSHLYVSSSPVADFPGRAFRIETTTTLNKRDLRQSLAGIPQANITVRNFPLSVAELRKRLKIKDGGDRYIFATTLADSTHCLLICLPAAVERAQSS